MIRSRAFLAASLASLVWNLLAGVGPVEAQAISRVPEMKIFAGSVKTYLDEPAQVAVGGALRMAITPRLSFEPEVLRVAGDRFASWQILGNATFALSTNPQVTPYVVAGIGIIRELDKAIDYHSAETTWNAGFGVRFAVNERVSFSTEARLGLNTFPRLAAGVGVALGR